jgi:hypothetical protein
MSKTTLFIGGANRPGEDCDARPDRIQGALEKLFSGEGGGESGSSELAFGAQECR